MSFAQRVASFAALSLGLIGLSAHSTAGYAAEIDRSVVSASVPIPTPASIILPNTQAAAQVPTPAPTTPPADDAQDGDEVAYPTLAAAVAAQSIRSDADEQLRCLAGAIYYESKGEPLAGQLAVAEVILNRVGAGRFGDSVCDVVTQRGQFSFVRAGRIPAVSPSKAAYLTAMAVAKVALADAWDSQAAKALYFHARRVSPGWNRTKIAAIGNHIFYR